MLAGHIICYYSTCDTVEMPLMTSFNRSQTTLHFSSHSYLEFQAPFLRVCMYRHTVWTHNYYQFVFFLFFIFISFLSIFFPSLFLLIFIIISIFTMFFILLYVFVFLVIFFFMISCFFIVFFLNIFFIFFLWLSLQPNRTRISLCFTTHGTDDVTC